MKASLKGENIIGTNSKTNIGIGFLNIFILFKQFNE
jgi:hypothetical protein